MTVELTVIDRSVEAGGRGDREGSELWQTTARSMIGLVLETDWLLLDSHRFLFSPPLDLRVSEG